MCQLRYGRPDRIVNRRPPVVTVVLIVNLYRTIKYYSRFIAGERHELHDRHEPGARPNTRWLPGRHFRLLVRAVRPTQKGNARRIFYSAGVFFSNFFFLVIRQSHVGRRKYRDRVARAETFAGPIFTKSSPDDRFLFRHRRVRLCMKKKKNNNNDSYKRT